MRYETYLITDNPVYQRYSGTVVSKLRYIGEDDLEEGLSRMLLVQLNDGRIVTVFEDELKDIESKG